MRGEEGESGGEMRACEGWGGDGRGRMGRGVSLLEGIYVI